MTFLIYLNVLSYIFLHPQAFQRFCVSLVFPTSISLIYDF